MFKTTLSAFSLILATAACSSEGTTGFEEPLPAKAIAGHYKVISYFIDKTDQLVEEDLAYLSIEPDGNVRYYQKDNLSSELHFIKTGDAIFQAEGGDFFSQRGHNGKRMFIAIPTADGLAFHYPTVEQGIPYNNITNLKRISFAPVEQVEISHAVPVD